MVPSHPRFDGDLVFAAASGAGPPPARGVELLAIGPAASLRLARAIARGVRHATPEPGDLLPCWSSDS